MGRESATGFRQLRCQVCNDHSERAGFKFDGSIVGYNCFNCTAKFTFEEGSTRIGKNTRYILECFGITREEINEVIGSSFFKQASEPTEITMAAIKPTIKLFTPEVPLPPKSHPLGAPLCDELQAPLIEYLVARRIDPLKVNAHFSVDPKFLNRVILPCMRDGKIIYWQARTIRKDVKQRYLSPSIAKDAVLWGYDNMWKDYTLPLFVTEGIFDAACVDGVALLGATINESKFEVFKRCRRRKIVVVDRNDKGGALADLALSRGWEVTFPPENSSDINDSIQKNGRLLTIWALMKNATVPTPFKTADGISVQSKLELDMQLALAKMRK